MIRWQLLAAPLAALLLVCAPGTATSGEPVTAATSMEQLEVAIRAVLAECESWPPIPEGPPALFVAADNGKQVKLGDTKAYHKNTEYGHVDVILVYAFGSSRYQLAKLGFGQERLSFAIRGQDGSILVPRMFKLSWEADPTITEMVRLTFEYELTDGTTGTAVHAKPAPPPDSAPAK